MIGDRQLMAEASDILRRTLVAIRLASDGTPSGDRRVATIHALADATHNMPGWLHPDDAWKVDEAHMRRELDEATRHLKILEAMSGIRGT